MHAINSMQVDHCVDLEDMTALLDKLSREPAEQLAVPIPDQIRIESQLTAMEKIETDLGNIGKVSPFTCPACQGTLWEINDENLLRFRCHTGHSFSAESLVNGQDEVLEQALYEALRALEEKAGTARRIAQRLGTGGNPMEERFEKSRPGGGIARIQDPGLDLERPGVV